MTNDHINTISISQPLFGQNKLGLMGIGA